MKNPVAPVALVALSMTNGSNKEMARCYLNTPIPL
jgi:hypothetical protein